MLNELIAWWLERMRELLPARLLREQAGPRQALIVTAEDDFDPENPADPSTISLARRRRTRELPVGRFTLDEPGRRAARAALGNRDRGVPVILRLQPDNLLEREVVLPLAAERDLAQVLHYEMDRFSPFAADEVFWTFAISRRDRASGRVFALVSLAPKARLEGLIAALNEIGVAPSLLEAPLPGGSVRQIGLGQPDVRRDRLRRLALVGAGALCAAFALAVVAVPFVRQSGELAELDARIASLKPGVARAETLRKQMASESSGADALASETARVGDMLQALAALTDLLPDDTFLNALTVRARKLTMDGQSAAANKLIAALSTDPVIKDATFAAPVTRTVSGEDAFSIRAELGQ
jgi:general secretion pathway protein L